MLSVPEAFEKFKSRLEISASEQQDASRHQQHIRTHVRAQLAAERDFLSGSYARHTKTRPLKGVDIFVVLKDSESDYLDQDPNVILDTLIEILSPHYSNRTSKGNRSVKIDRHETSTPDQQVLSFDVVPAFVENSHYEIPDRRQFGWIKTNPDVRRKKATAANAGFSECWKPCREDGKEMERSSRQAGQTLLLTRGNGT